MLCIYLEGACTGLVLAVEVVEHTGDWGHCSGVRLQRLRQGRAGVRTGGGNGGRGQGQWGRGGQRQGREGVGRCKDRVGEGGGEGARTCQRLQLALLRLGDVGRKAGELEATRGNVL